MPARHPLFILPFAISAFLFAQEQPTVRVATRLVQVNVLALDRSGKPVPDLRREEFHLFEEGKEKPIQVFSVEGEGRQRSDPLPPGTFSNHRGKDGTTAGSVTVIVIDRVNTRFEDLAYARKEIMKFLSQIRRGDRVGLYILDRGTVRVVHDFTSDAGPLARAIGRQGGLPSSDLAASEPEAPETGDPDLDEMMRDANEKMAIFYTTNRVESTLRGLEAIANHLAGVPGRKNLVWVSAAFPSIIMGNREIRTYSQEISRAMRAVNNADVAIYPVDARGLIVPFDNLSGGRPVFGTMGTTRTGIDTMKELAERTGGRAYYNSNDIGGAVRRTIEDSRTNYVLGYYPDSGNWDGRFREIKVRVDRSGVQVRHRRGYYALLGERADAAQLQELMRDAARIPLESTGVALDAQIQVENSAAGRVANLRLRLGPQALTLTHSENHWIGAFDVFVAQRLPEGRFITSVNSTINVRLTAENHEKLMKEGLAMSRRIDLQAEADEIRAVVRDRSTGQTGSIIIPLAGSR